jgi:hypothetical protein
VARKRKRVRDHAIEREISEREGRRKSKIGREKGRRGEKAVS